MRLKRPSGTTSVSKDWATNSSMKWMPRSRLSPRDALIHRVRFADVRRARVPRFKFYGIYYLVRPQEEGVENVTTDFTKGTDGEGRGTEGAAAFWSAPTCRRYRAGGLVTR